jgi:antitoxin VapB
MLPRGWSRTGSGPVQNDDGLCQGPPSFSKTAGAKPSACRPIFDFEGEEVYIRQDPATGDVILSRRPESWEGFFILVAEAGVLDSFMSDRDDRLPQKHKLFRRALHAVVNEFLIRVTTQQERQRRQIGNLDMTIAAHALAQGAVLVTNEEAFSGIKGLKIENWAA